MIWWPAIQCAVVGLVTALVTIAVTLRAARSPRWSFLQGRRDYHHTNKIVIPRLGGLALAVACLGIEVFITLFHPALRAHLSWRPVVLISSLAMFLLGLWDDLKPMGAKRKLIGQILIATSVCCFGLNIQLFRVPFLGQEINLAFWGYPLTVLWLVGMTNLINLIDGADGIAGGICLMLMALLAYMGQQTGGFVFTAAGMVGALLGFLWFNFPPARIYLGDGGAYLLGFQIGLISILNSQKGTVAAALAAPLFVLALPIVDTALAILRRGLRGLPVFRPDRKHIHHRLLQMGFSRRQMVLAFYLTTLVFLSMGFAAFWSQGRLVPVLLGAAVLIILVFARSLSFSREWFAVGRIVGNSLEMRREVQYALSLTRWLALEGERCGSVEELWPDLIFVARKLGFVSVTLSLADGRRNWEAPNGANALLSVRQELHGGRAGVLELKAHSCPAQEFETGVTPQGQVLCDRQLCPCIANGALFEILSDLLAEAWVHSALRCIQNQQAALRFDSKLPAAVGLRRRPSFTFGPMQVVPEVEKD